MSALKRVLLFAPHPDDESIGCGGTLALLAQHATVHAALITDGSGAGALPAGSCEIRQREFVNALAALGVHNYTCLGEPDGAFKESEAFRKRVSALLDTYKPDSVFLPSPLDYHRDHVRASVVLTELCRKTRFIDQLLYYEIWCPVPATHVVDITAAVAQKRAALQSHVTALAARDYLAASMGLAAYRALYLAPAPFQQWAEAFWVEPVRQRSAFDEVLNLALRTLRRLS